MSDKATRHLVLVLSAALLSAALFIVFSGRAAFRQESFADDAVRSRPPPGATASTESPDLSPGEPARREQLVAGPSHDVDGFQVTIIDVADKAVPHARVLLRVKDALERATADSRGVFLGRFSGPYVELTASDDRAGVRSRILLRDRPEDRRITVRLLPWGTIHVRVWDAAGKPVGGAQVQVRVSGAVENSNGMPTPPGPSWSDHEGRATIMVDGEGVYTLSARDAAGATSPGARAYVLAGDESWVDLYIDPPFRLTGRVVDQAGKGIHDANVTAVAAGAFVGQADRVARKTSDDGAFEIALQRPGAYRMAARKAGYVAWSIVEATVDRDEPTTEVTLQLRSQAEIRGVVLSETGTAVAGAAVTAEPVLGDVYREISDCMLFAVPDGIPRPRLACRAGGDGAFAFGTEFFVGGKWRVSAWATTRENHVLFGSMEVDADAGSAPLRLTTRSIGDGSNPVRLRLRDGGTDEVSFWRCKRAGGMWARGWDRLVIEVSDGIAELDRDELWPDGALMVRGSGRGALLFGDTLAAALERQEIGMVVLHDVELAIAAPAGQSLRGCKVVLSRADYLPVIPEVTEVEGASVRVGLFPGSYLATVIRGWSVLGQTRFSVPASGGLVTLSIRGGPF